MVTEVFSMNDSELYSTWHLENGGVVCISIPGVGELRMTPAKALQISESLKRMVDHVSTASASRTPKDSLISKPSVENFSFERNRRYRVTFRLMDSERSKLKTIEGNFIGQKDDVLAFNNDSEYGVQLIKGNLIMSAMELGPTVWS